MPRTRALVLVAGVMTVLLVLAGCAAAPKDVTVDQTRNGSTLTLQKGARLIVKLDSNPTTGFDWYLSGSLPSVVTTSSDEYKSGASGTVVGAGGVHTFTYLATATGSGEIRLVYVRPWEKGATPEKTFAIRVEVK